MCNHIDFPCCGCDDGISDELARELMESDGIFWPEDSDDVYTAEYDIDPAFDPGEYDPSDEDDIYGHDEGFYPEFDG